jgi:hypothetical protein
MELVVGQEAGFAGFAGVDEEFAEVAITEHDDDTVLVHEQLCLNELLCESLRCRELRDIDDR